MGSVWLACPQYRPRRRRPIPQVALRAFRSHPAAMHGHQRFLRNEQCMLLRAGNRVYVAAQALDSGFMGLGDPAAQAEQAIRNIEEVLQQAGADMAHIRRVTTYLTDRAWREA